MYIYIYIHIYVWLARALSVPILKCIYVYLRVCEKIHIRVWMYMHVHAYMYIYVCVHIHMHMRAWMHIRVHAWNIDCSFTFSLTHTLVFSLSLSLSLTPPSLLVYPSRPSSLSASFLLALCLAPALAHFPTYTLSSKTRIWAQPCLWVPQNVVQQQLQLQQLNTPSLAPFLSHRNKDFGMVSSWAPQVVVQEVAQEQLQQRNNLTHPHTPSLFLISGKNAGTDLSWAPQDVITKTQLITLIHTYRVAKTHRIPYLYRSFSAKEPYI